MSPTPRLNPFAFPSDTDLRFILLVAVVLVSSLIIFMNRLPIDEVSDASLKKSVENFAKSIYPYDERKMNAEDIKKYLPDGTDNQTELWRELYADFTKNVGPILRRDAMKALVASIFLVGMAAIIYWYLPKWKIWRDKLIPLASEDAPEVVLYLAELCHEVGLSPPIFLWNPLNPSISSGVAFGRMKRYYVSLPGGLVTRFYTDRPGFRAIILHELAHLYNADINKTYFAIAMWQAFAIFAAFSLALDIVNTSFQKIGTNWISTFEHSWRLLALTGLVYLTRNAILQARETYADLRAFLWEGKDGVLCQILEKFPSPKIDRPWKKFALFHAHPKPIERLRTLNEIHLLFRLGYWETFGSGVVLMAIFRVLYFFVKLFLIETQPSLLFLIGTLTALIVAPLLIGIIVVGIWRVTFALLIRNDMSPHIGRLALAIASGIILGDFLSFGGGGIPRFEGFSIANIGAISQWIFTEGPFELMRFGFNVLWYGILWGCLFLFLHWLIAGSSIWLNTISTKRRSHLFCIGGVTIIASFLFALWFGILYLWKDMVNLQDSRGIKDLVTLIPQILGDYPEIEMIIKKITPQGFLLLSLLFSFFKKGITIFTTTGFYVPLIFFFVWAFPLSARFLQKRNMTISFCHWAFIEPPSESEFMVSSQPLRPSLSLIVGTIGGLGCCATLIPLFLNILGQSPLSLTQAQMLLTANTIERLWVYQFFVQIIAAGIVAFITQQVAWAHGMFSAFLVGCFVFTGERVVLSITNIPISSELFFGQFSGIITFAGFWALLVTLKMPALSRWIHALPSRVPIDEQVSIAEGRIKLFGRGWGVRGVAFILDCVIWYIISQACSLIAIPIAIVLIKRVNIDIIALKGIPNLCNELLLFILYFIVFEGLHGATIGKFLLKLYVIQENGKPSNFRIAVIRNMMRCIDMILLCIPTFVVMQVPLQQSISDKVAKTVVIEPFFKVPVWKGLITAIGIYIVLNIILKQIIIIPAFY